MHWNGFEHNKTLRIVIVTASDIDSNHIIQKQLTYLLKKILHRNGFDPDKSLCIVIASASDIDSNHIIQKELRYLSKEKSALERI